MPGERRLEGVRPRRHHAVCHALAEPRPEGPALRALLQTELQTFGSRFATDNKQQASKPAYL